MGEQRPDDIYAHALDSVGDFKFDDAVARVFPDMIRRSVPGYTTIIPMIGLITERYAQDNTVCYDLGCSLGASTLAMRHGLKDRNCKLIGVDNSPSMIERCNHYIELDNEKTPVELLCEDVTKLEFQTCSVVTLNFTLQFIEPELRLKLLSDIYKSLKPGSALVLSEKICFDDKNEQKELEELHWLFKRANGYSELEVSQKRSALEKVLLPDTLATHQDRLNQAGFAHTHLWYQCFNFMSLIAIKAA